MQVFPASMAVLPLPDRDHQVENIVAGFFQGYARGNATGLVATGIYTVKPALLFFLTLLLVASERQNTVEHGFSSPVSDVYAVSQDAFWLSDRAQGAEGDDLSVSASVALLVDAPRAFSPLLRRHPHSVVDSPLSTAHAIRAPPAVLV